SRPARGQAVLRFPRPRAVLVTGTALPEGVVPMSAAVPGVRTADTPTADELHRRFLAILPVIERHGRVCFGRLKCQHRLEEALAEMAALAWKWFLRLVEQGKDAADFPATLAAYAARAVRSGRRVCGQERARDVLSPRAPKRQHFTVQPLPAYEPGVEATATVDALRDNTGTPPDEQAAFRIDFPAWLRRLGDRNGRIAQDMALGERTQELAGKYGTSQARISQLRREFRDDWRRFTGADEA